MLRVLGPQIAASQGGRHGVAKVAGQPQCPAIIEVVHAEKLAILGDLRGACHRQLLVRDRLLVGLNGIREEFQFFQHNAQVVVHPAQRALPLHVPRILLDKGLLQCQGKAVRRFGRGGVPQFALGPAEIINPTAKV